MGGRGSGGNATTYDRTTGIVTTLPTSEVLSYFHSVITTDNISKEFVSDIRANGVRQPIEIVTDGKKAAIADGHHRTLSASQAGVKSVPVRIFKVSSESMQGGRGDKIGGKLNTVITKNNLFR